MPLSPEPLYQSASNTIAPDNSPEGGKEVVSQAGQLCFLDI
jgi:hypothetical protein